MPKVVVKSVRVVIGISDSESTQLQTRKERQYRAEAVGCGPSLITRGCWIDGERMGSDGGVSQLTESSCFDAAEVVYHFFCVFEIEQSVVTVRKM